MVLHRVTQEGGVGKAGSLCRDQVVRVLDDDGVLALQHEVVGRLAGGLAAADEQDLVADFLLVLEKLGEREGFLEARDGGHGARDGAAGDDDVVEAAERVDVGHLGVEADVDAFLGDLVEVPADELLIVLLEAHRGSGEEQTAELVGLLEDDGGVAALLEHERALHAADAAADDGDLLRVAGRDDLVLVVLHGGRVQRAASQVQGVIHALEVRGALELGHVEAAVVAADAGLDLVLVAAEDLVDPLVVNEVLTRDGDSVETAGSDLFGSLHGVHTAGADDRAVGELLDVLDVLEVAVVGHVLRRMCPVPRIVGAVVAVEHVVAGFLEVLDSLLGLGHVAAELLKVGLVRHRALAPGLGLGDDGVTQGHREVGAGLTLDLLHDLDREAETVLERAAVLVGAVVPVGHGELVKQVALVDSVDLDAVDAGSAQLLGGLAEGAHHVLDLLDGQRAGHDVFLPAVRDLGSGGADVLHVDDGAGDLVEEVVLGQHRHPAVDRHGTAHAGGELDEELCTGLVELDHVLLELLEHLVVLVQPLTAGDAQRIADALHAGQDQAHAVLRAVEQEVSCFLVKVVRLHPAEQGRAAHGALDNAVFHLDIADLPGGEQCVVLFVH